MPLTKSLTVQQMGEVSRLLTEQYDLTWLEKIEMASQALSKTAQRLFGGPVAGQSFIVVAGPGNKGAVGLATARHLHGLGAKVQVVLAVRPATLHTMAAHQYTLLQELGLEAWGLALDEGAMARQEPIAWTSTALIVDALLGTGLQGDPRGEAADLIRLINSTRRRILSFDMPSGLSGDEGAILSPCVQATATLSLALPLQGLLEGWPVVGELWVADIGVPRSLYKRLGLEVEDLFDGEPLVCLGPARKVKAQFLDS